MGAAILNTAGRLGSRIQLSRGRSSPSKSNYKTILYVDDSVMQHFIISVFPKIKGPSFTQFSMYFLPRFHEALYVLTERNPAP